MNLGAYHPHTIVTLDNLALAYLDKGRPGQALPLWQQAAAGLEKLRFVHGDSEQIILNLCMCLERMGRLDQSILWRRKWLAAEREKAGPRSVAYAKGMVKVARYLLEGERHAEAELFLREGLAILQETRTEGWETSHARTMLGHILLGRKNYAEAEPLLIQGYEGLKAHKDQIPPLLADYLVAVAGEAVGELYEAWGRPAEAAAWRSRHPGSGQALEHASHVTPKDRTHPEPTPSRPR
jgi:tetratricopeptide (TPR) repeat protein